jgi:hypothetical protein
MAQRCVRIHGGWNILQRIPMFVAVSGDQSIQAVSRLRTPEVQMVARFSEQLFCTAA